jgi:hypothetical protein
VDSESTSPRQDGGWLSVDLETVRGIEVAGLWTTVPWASNTAEQINRSDEPMIVFICSVFHTLVAQ